MNCMKSRQEKERAFWNRFAEFLRSFGFSELSIQQSNRLRQIIRYRSGLGCRLAECDESMVNAFFYQPGQGSLPVLRGDFASGGCGQIFFSSWRRFRGRNRSIGRGTKHRFGLCRLLIRRECGAIPSRKSGNVPIPRTGISRRAIRN